MKIYENDEIYVRPLEQSDVESDDYLQWFYDPEICKYNSHGRFSHPNCGYQYVREKDESRILWAVILKERQKLSDRYIKEIHIGNCCLQDIDWIDRKAEFTCIFGEKEYWKKGYGTQALKWIIEHGLYKLNLHKVWLGTAESNIGMNKAAEKAGMELEAVLQDDIILNGRFENINRWSIFNV